MQTTCSIYRIIDDPDGAADVQLDFGDEMIGEPTLPGGQNVQAARYPGARASGHFHRGNNEVRLSWTRVFYFTTNAQARAYGIAAHANAPWGRTSDRRIEFQDGSQLRVKGSVLENLEPEFITEEGIAAVVLSYDAVGGEVIVEASGGFAADNWSAQTQTWSAWANKFNHISAIQTN